MGEKPDRLIGFKEPITGAVFDAHAVIADHVRWALTGRYARYTGDIKDNEESKYSAGPYSLSLDPDGNPGQWALFLECAQRAYFAGTAVSGDEAETMGATPYRTETDIQIAIVDVDGDAAAGPLDPHAAADDFMALYTVVEEAGPEGVRREVSIPDGLTVSEIGEAYDYSALLAGWLHACFTLGSGGGPPAA